MNKEIEIPEGYEAKIEGNKIIFEPKETKDEKIRKALLRCCDDWEKGQFGCMAKEDVPAIRAWLEKQKELPTNDEMLRTLRAEYEKGVADTIAKYEQKEQKPADDKAFEEWLDNWYQDAKDAEGRIIMTKWEFKNWSRGIRNMYEQNPVEWSEEDERVKNLIIDILDRDEHNGRLSRSDLISCVKFIKSFSPQPKQEWSEEEIVNWLKENFEVSSFDNTKIVTKFSSMHDLIKSFRERFKSLRPQPQGIYKQVIHTIFGMLKDKDFYFYKLQPSHMVSLLDDIRVKCKDAIECAPTIDEPHWKPSKTQIAALKVVARGFPADDPDAIDSLLDDLESL